MDPESDHTEGLNPRLVARYGLSGCYGHIVTTRREGGRRSSQIALADEQDVGVEC